MTVSPDLAYDKSRVDLLVFEDTSFNALISNVPNYYYGPNEVSVFGSILKAYAIELGRLDFDLNYDILARDPRYLTPADIKRKYEQVLQMSKSYPTPTQYDKDYKDLVLSLLDAYREGSRVDAIQKVISAYTTYPVQVTELYKLISTGVYDISDKNAINISITTPSGNINDSLRLITKDLFGAIDAIKPAHVGINLEEVFTETLEIPGTIISNIADSLQIYVTILEGQPLDGVFTVAPFYQTEPESTLSGDGGGAGVLAPQLALAWEIKHDTLIGIDLD